MAVYIAEAALYSAYMILDIAGLCDTRWIKYAAVLLLLFSVADRRDGYVTFAFAFTAAADFFLLVLDRFYWAGILLFMGAQICYALRSAEGLRETGLLLARRSRILALSLILCAFSLPPLIGGRSPEGSLAFGYILLFVLNILLAAVIAARRKRRADRLFAAGLLLYFLCDICVGLHNLLPDTCPPLLLRMTGLGMWAFYIPGLNLIRASACLRGPATAQGA